MQPRTPFQPDATYLGDPVMVGGPPRSHLVPPQPPPLVVKRDLEQQVLHLSTRLGLLEARVAVLEQPWWWTRLATALRGWWRVAWGRIRKE